MNIDAAPQTIECRAAAELSGRHLGQALALAVVDDERWVAAFTTQDPDVGFWVVMVRPDTGTRFHLSFDRPDSVVMFTGWVRELSDMV